MPDTPALHEYIGRQSDHEPDGPAFKEWLLGMQGMVLTTLKKAAIKSGRYLTAPIEVLTAIKPPLRIGQRREGE
ncbi:MAG: hypothetical protein ACREQW_09855 [Candidatus Binatia bacterium]